MVGKLPARNFAHANVDTPENPKAQEPNQHLLPPRSQWRRNIVASIVEGKDTLPVSVANHDVSIQYRQPLKYKMATIPTLNLRLSPEGILCWSYQVSTPSWCQV